MKEANIDEISLGHRPCVLLVSRPVNEITYQLSQLGREEKIVLVGIPQAVRHLLQPIDDGLGKLYS